MNMPRAAMAAMLAAVALAGCSGGFGGPKRSQPTATVDPNSFPANYRTQIATLLATTLLKDREDFKGARIAAPALKTVADGQNQHYVVCLQLNGNNQRKDKVVVFLGGDPSQYIDAKPEQCADAVYQPFTELESAIPDTTDTSNPFDFSYKQ